MSIIPAKARKKLTDKGIFAHMSNTNKCTQQTSGGSGPGILDLLFADGEHL